MSQNLNNSEYMQILLNGQSSLEDLFAKIDATEVRNELQAAEGNIEKIPAKLKRLTSKADYPEMLKKYFFGLKSNGILC
jgi:hypothetical protein